MERENIVKEVCAGLSNYFYRNEIEATKQLMDLLDGISTHPLETSHDYVYLYDSSFYTYKTWKELLKSEEEQSDGWTEEECTEQIEKSIFQLPCGWYVQMV